MTRIKRWLMGKRRIVWSEPALPPYVKINPNSPPGAAADGLQPGDMSMLSVAEEFLATEDPEEDDDTALPARCPCRTGRCDQLPLELAVAYRQPAERAVVDRAHGFPGMARVARWPDLANDPHHHQRRVLRCGCSRRRPAVGSRRHGRCHHLHGPDRAAGQPARLRAHRAHCSKTSRSGPWRARRSCILPGCG